MVSPCCLWCDSLYDPETDIPMSDGTYMHYQCYIRMVQRDAFDAAMGRIFDILNNSNIDFDPQQFAADMQMVKNWHPQRFTRMRKQIDEWYSKHFDVAQIA